MTGKEKQLINTTNLNGIKPMLSNVHPRFRTTVFLLALAKPRAVIDHKEQAKRKPCFLQGGFAVSVGMVDNDLAMFSVLPT